MSAHPRPYSDYSHTRVRCAGGDDTAGFEAVLCGDGRPVAVVRLNRVRATPFVLDGDDPWAGGDVWTTRDQKLATLWRPAYGSREPEVWSQAALDFVPVG